MSETPSTASAGLPSQNFFRLVSVIAGMWWLALIGIAVRTANPVTLNARQIARADGVVLARVVDRAAGQVEVEEAWKFDLPRGPLTISNLATSQPALTGSPLLIPLSHADDGYTVTLVPPPGPGAVVYPATPSTREQLERLLKSSP